MSNISFLEARHQLTNYLLGSSRNTADRRFAENYLKRIILDDRSISYVNELVVRNKICVVTQKMG